jgi:hypothetical protein
MTENNLTEIKSKVSKQARSILKSEFRGRITLDHNVGKVFHIVIKNLKFDDFSPSDVAFICGITPTAFYNIKRKAPKTLSQSTLIGLMDGLFDGCMTFEA